METQSQKPRWPRGAALQVAREVIAVLRPVCERLVVAGSLRRGMPSVGDVEILFIGKTETRPKVGELFGTETVDFAVEAIEQLLQAGVLAKRVNKIGGVAWGDKNRLAVHVATGMPVDLFAAQEANWWNYLVCRTGSAESNTRIAQKAQSEGWKWNPYGPGFTCNATGKKVAVKSEEEVFTFLGLPYLRPEERQ